MCGKALRCALGCVDLATVFEFQGTGKRPRWERLGMNMHLGGEILGWGALAICWALEFTQSQLILYT